MSLLVYFVLGRTAATSAVAEGASPPPRAAVLAAAEDADAESILHPKQSGSQMHLLLAHLCVCGGVRRVRRGGLGASGSFTSFSQLASHDVLEIAPRWRAPEAVCVVTVYTEDLLLGWGRYAAEVNANWALMHGYRFISFRRQLVSEENFFGWSHPRALHLALGRDDCAFVFLLDGDAVINRVNRSLGPLIRSHLGNESTAELLVTCHSPGDHDSQCLDCQCTRAASRCDRVWPHSRFCAQTKCFGPIFQEMKHKFECAPNSGVVLARNTPTMRRIAAFWTTFGEHLVPVNFGTTC